VSNDKAIYNRCLSEEDLRTLAFRPGTHTHEQDLLDHISSCELCSDAWEGLRLLSEDEYSESINAITEKIKQHTRTEDFTVRSLHRWYAVAASFAVLLTLAYWLNLSLNQKQKEVAQNLPSDTLIYNRKNTTLSNADKIQPNADATTANSFSKVENDMPENFVPPPVQSVPAEEKITYKVVPNAGYNKSDAEIKDIPQTITNEEYLKTSAPMQNNFVESNDKYYRAPVPENSTSGYVLKEQSIKNIPTSKDNKKQTTKEKNNVPTAPNKEEINEATRLEETTLLDSINTLKTISSNALLVQALQAFDSAQYLHGVEICNEIASRGDTYQSAALLLKAQCLLKLGKKNEAKKILNDLVKSNSPVKDEAQRLLNAY
jgi:hypothetical protein